MVRTNDVAVFPLSNAIGTIVQAVERSDVDTVMVAGKIRKRAGKLVDIDLARLASEATASRDYLLETSGYRAASSVPPRNNPSDPAGRPQAAAAAPNIPWRLSCQHSLR